MSCALAFRCCDSYVFLDSYSCGKYYVMSALGSLYFLSFLYFSFILLTALQQHAIYSVYLWSVFCIHINTMTYARDFFLNFIHWCESRSQNCIRREVP